jgi:drug/metabolite transporter (DMT)-like permease
MRNSKTHVLALVEALLVTFLWSTSYILIELGLEEINPLTFAAYRYAIASLILVLLMFSLYKKKSFLRFDNKRISVFFVLGFTGFFIAQGLQFFGLYYLQPVTVTFILNLTPIFVLLLSAFFLKEIPSSTQLIGIALTLCGVLIYFSNTTHVFQEVIGILLTLVSGIGWATYMVVSRYFLREESANIVVLTACSMALGSIMLIGTALFTGNVTQVSFDAWLIILWLSLINTALAFALWNHALKRLRVFEQSILQNTMLIQISVLAYVFLQETLIIQKILGMVLVFIGALIVQIRRK